MWVLRRGCDCEQAPGLGIVAQDVGRPVGMDHRPGARVRRPQALLGEAADQRIVLGDPLPDVQATKFQHGRGRRTRVDRVPLHVCRGPEVAVEAPDIDPARCRGSGPRVRRGSVPGSARRTSPKTGKASGSAMPMPMGWARRWRRFTGGPEPAQAEDGGPTKDRDGRQPCRESGPGGPARHRTIGRSAGSPRQILEGRAKRGRSRRQAAAVEGVAQPLVEETSISSLMRRAPGPRGSVRR